MDRKAALAVPYHLVRTPLTIFDKTVVRWLPERSGARRAYHKTTSAIDALAGRTPGGGGPSANLPVKAPTRSVVPQPPTDEASPASTRGPAARPRKAAAAQGTTAAPAEKATAKKAPAKQVAAKKTAAKKAARKAAPKPDTRANRSLSKIALDLAETEAIAEARETQAEQRVDAELSGETDDNGAPENP